MITRIEHEAKPVHTVITRQEYEADVARGYCILEYSPASTRMIKNPRDPRQEVRVPVEQTVIYRCMKCKFDAVSGDYNKTTGLSIIKEHVSGGHHPWMYGAFTSPYGNTADVSIEGISEYAQEIKK